MHRGLPSGLVLEFPGINEHTACSWCVKVRDRRKKRKNLVLLRSVVSLFGQQKTIVFANALIEPSLGKQTYRDTYPVAVDLITGATLTECFLELSELFWLFL